MIEKQGQVNGVVGLAQLLVPQRSLQRLVVHFPAPFLLAHARSGERAAEGDAAHRERAIVVEAAGKSGISLPRICIVRFDFAAHGQRLAVDVDCAEVALVVRQIGEDPRVAARAHVRDEVRRHDDIPVAELVVVLVARGRARVVVRAQHAEDVGLGLGVVRDDDGVRREVAHVSAVGLQILHGRRHEAEVRLRKRVGKRVALRLARLLDLVRLREQLHFVLGREIERLDADLHGVLILDRVAEQAPEKVILGPAEVVQELDRLTLEHAVELVLHHLHGDGEAALPRDRAEGLEIALLDAALRIRAVLADRLKAVASGQAAERRAGRRDRDVHEDLLEDLRLLRVHPRLILSLQEHAQRRLQLAEKRICGVAGLRYDNTCQIFPLLSLLARARHRARANKSAADRVADRRALECHDLKDAVCRGRRGLGAGRVDRHHLADGRAGVGLAPLRLEDRLLVHADAGDHVPGSHRAAVHADIVRSRCAGALCKLAARERQRHADGACPDGGCLEVFPRLGLTVAVALRYECHLSSFRPLSGLVCLVVMCGDLRIRRIGVERLVKGLDPCRDGCRGVSGRLPCPLLMLQPGRSVSRCLFSRCALAALQGIKVCQPVCVYVVVTSTHRIGKFGAGLHRHDVVQRLDGGVHPADLRQLRLAALRKLLRSGSLLSCLGALLRLLGSAEDLLDLRRLHQGLLQPLRCQPSGLEVICQLGVGRGGLECSPVLHVFHGLARKRILDPGLAKDLFFPLCPL
nr:MAG TPA: hypothetical protein [Caudoviricetes sp.]